MTKNVLKVGKFSTTSNGKALWMDAMFIQILSQFQNLKQSAQKRILSLLYQQNNSQPFLEAKQFVESAVALLIENKSEPNIVHKSLTESNVEKVTKSVPKIQTLKTQFVAP